MKITIGGDFAPRPIAGAMIAHGDYSFIESVKQISSNSDLTIVNLESPFIEPSDSPIIKYGPNIGCSPLTVNALKAAGIGMVTLANNHILDFGEKAMFRTAEICEANDIMTVGIGKNTQDASRPRLIPLNGKTLAIINCCEQEFSTASSDKPGACHLDAVSQFNTIRAIRDKADFIIVITHGGHELFNLPSPRMQQLYRFFIDAGADAVVNHHQHCYSGYEIYNKKPIFYGLGNLCFDGNSNSPECWSYGYLVTLNFDAHISFEIHPYSQFKQSDSIELLPSDAFNDTINRLNAIIAKPESLKTEIEKYYSQSTGYTSTIFDIYTNPIMLALRNRKLIPSFLSQKMRLRIMNHVLCESHRDKLDFYFNHQT